MRGEHGRGGLEPLQFFDIIGHEAARIERAVSMKTILIHLNDETVRYDLPQGSMLMIDAGEVSVARLVISRPKEPQVVLEADEFQIEVEN